MIFKVRLKNFALQVMASAGRVLPSLRSVRSPGSRSLTILTYHSVGDRRGHETNVGLNAFRHQMEALSLSGQVVDLNDILMTPDWWIQDDEHRVAVTLDDGYADTFTDASPILKQSKVPATCFVVAGFVGTQRLLDHDRGLTQESAGILSQKQVRGLADAGVIVGSHGMNHRRFSRLKDDELKWEIGESKRVLEALTGRSVRLLSFPYGRVSDFDHRAVRLAKETGYDLAVTAMYGENTLASNPWKLRRIGVESSDSLYTLRGKIEGHLDVLRYFETAGARAWIKKINRLLGS